VKFKNNNPEKLQDVPWLKKSMRISWASFYLAICATELLVEITSKVVIPFLRQNNWMTRNLVVAGNFNLTNVEELIYTIWWSIGQHPREKADTVTVMENIGHWLDEENDLLVLPATSKMGIRKKILVLSLLKSSMLEISFAALPSIWDGGYM
jgi:amidophosphoribosyltransferase